MVVIEGYGVCECEEEQKERVGEERAQGSAG